MDNQSNIGDAQCTATCIAIISTIAGMLIVCPLFCCAIVYYNRWKFVRKQIFRNPGVCDRAASDHHEVKRWQARHPPERRAFSYPISLHICSYHPDELEHHYSMQPMREEVSETLPPPDRSPRISQVISSFSFSTERGRLCLELSNLAEKKIKKSIRLLQNASTVEFKATKHGCFERNVQSNLPIFSSASTYTYFELKILECKPQTTISVGYTTKPYPPFRLPGMELYSVAYKSTNGHKFFNNPYDGDAYGPQFGVGDIVGCGYINLEGGLQTYFFTKNGLHLGDAITTSELFGDSYACIGANGPCLLTVNFGESEFRYDHTATPQSNLNVETATLPCLMCQAVIPEDQMDEHMDTHSLRHQSVAIIAPIHESCAASDHHVLPLSSSREPSRLSLLSPPSYETVITHQGVG
jgi:hypothetical protein